MWNLTTGQRSSSNYPPAIRNVVTRDFVQRTLLDVACVNSGVWAEMADPVIRLANVSETDVVFLAGPELTFEQAKQACTE